MRRIPVPTLQLLSLLALLALSACTADPSPLVGTPADVPCCTEVRGDSAGFVLGAWQGFIAPFAFVAWLFGADVAIYEVRNNGGWYDFGFLLGVSSIFGGSGGGAHARWRGRGANAG